MLKVVPAMPEEEIDNHQVVRESYSKVHARLTEINAEIARLEKARWIANGGDDIDEAAEAYLAGTPPPDSFEPDLKRLVAERVVVERAVAIGRNRVAAANEIEKNRIKKSLRPAHREAAARVAACVIQLGEANAEESRIRHQAAPGKLDFLSYPGADMSQFNSTAKHFLRFLKRHGIEPAPRTEAE